MLHVSDQWQGQNALRTAEEASQGTLLKKPETERVVILKISGIVPHCIRRKFNLARYDFIRLLCKLLVNVWRERRITFCILYAQR